MNKVYPGIVPWSWGLTKRFAIADAPALSVSPGTKGGRMAIHKLPIALGVFSGRKPLIVESGDF